MPEWIVESSQLSDIGLRRRHNEDYVACYEPNHPAELATHGRLYVLADGVGGGAAGEVASEYAVERIIYSYYQDQDGTPAGRLCRAVDTANAAICAHNRERTDRREMATTVVAALIVGDQLTVANVGDSRAYLIHDGTIDQITQDHSLVAEMINEGSLTPQQAEAHPYRNVILRSIGPNDSVKVDLFTRQIAPRHTVFLCSDGLTRRVSDQEIAHIVTPQPSAQAARQLIDLANERGGEDNITVSITHITDQLLRNVTDGAAQRPQMPHWDDF